MAGQVWHALKAADPDVVGAGLLQEGSGPVCHAPHFEG